MPTPDPVGCDADALRRDIEAAIDRDDVNDALNISVRATFLTAINICRGAGIEFPRVEDTSLGSLCGAFMAACDAHLATDDDFRVTCAREAFDAIAMAMSALQVMAGSEGASDKTARLLLLGGRLGHADLMLGLITTGLWAEYGTAVRSMYERGAHLRDRIPDWEQGFMSVATRFCEGKDNVTYGALVTCARGWAASEIASGRNPGLPATDDGIKAGLKRMQERGLDIPGKTGGN